MTYLPRGTKGGEAGRGSFAKGEEEGASKGSADQGGMMTYTWSLALTASETLQNSTYAWWSEWARWTKGGESLRGASSMDEPRRTITSPSPPCFVMRKRTYTQGAHGKGVSSRRRRRAGGTKGWWQGMVVKARVARGGKVVPSRGWHRALLSNVGMLPMVVHHRPRAELPMHGHPGDEMRGDGGDEELVRSGGSVGALYGDVVHQIDGGTACRCWRSGEAPAVSVGKSLGEAAVAARRAC